MARTSSPSAAVRHDRGTKVVYARTIGKSAEELFDHLRDFSRLIRLFREPLQLSQTAKDRFAATSADGKLTIASIIINERRPQLIAWKSEPSSDFVHAGTVRLDPAPGDEGTEVTVTLEYEPKGGKVGGAISSHLPDGPKRVIADTLRRFRAFVETGEFPTIEGQPVGEPQKSKLKKKESK